MPSTEEYVLRFLCHRAPSKQFRKWHTGKAEERAYIEQWGLLNLQGHEVFLITQKSRCPFCVNH